MVGTEAFQRARSPEQKAHRRATILGAAARLGSAKGVRAVSLGDIALEVGLTKSNVLRYFETREDIYLQLTAAGYREWADRVAGRLGRSPAAGPAEVAAALAEGLAADPLFCDLVSEGAAALEHNVSPDAVRTFKRTLFAALEDLAGVLAAHGGPLTLEQSREVLSATLMLSAGLWPWCNPPAVLVELYRTDAELARTRLEYVPQLRRLIEVVVVGLLAEAG
jgi:AcrR family transcriptional regulator